MPSPGVNYINVLLATFTLEDPKSAKQLLDLTVFFALLGSAGVRAAAHRTLVKLIPTRTFDFNSLISFVLDQFQIYIQYSS